MENTFRVSVGAYVPFRAKATGKKVPYLCVSHAIPDGETEIDQKCIFDGTLHQTPFVVIRRTSNPSDPRRVITPIASPGSNPRPPSKYERRLGRPMDREKTQRAS